MYKSLHQLIQPHIEMSFDNLPEDVRDRVVQDFFPHSWNRSTPAERLTLSLELDKQLDPALSEHAYWFDLQRQIGEIDRQLADAHVVSRQRPAIETQKCKERAAELERQLDVLKEKWYRPDFVAGSAQQRELERNKASHCPGVIEMPEALQFLAQNTGTMWTDSQLLSFASKCHIDLYAAVPPWTPTTIIRYRPDGGLFSRPHIEPGRHLLAVLSHGLVGAVWMAGKATATGASYSPFPDFGDTICFAEPIQVVRNDVRLTNERLLRILREWESIRCMSSIPATGIAPKVVSVEPDTHLNIAMDGHAPDLPPLGDNFPDDLFEQVLHAIEGSEVHSDLCYLANGQTETVVRTTMGPDRWIQRVKSRRFLSPIEFLALVHFVLLDFSHPGQDEKSIVLQWGEALLGSVLCGEVTARDPHSLLPLANHPNGLDWVIFLPDAEKFVASRGMEWTCSEVIDHIFAESFGMPASTQSAAAKSDCPQADPTRSSAKTEWTLKARALANEYISAWRAAGYAPTVGDAALYVEGVFSTEDVFNTRGEAIDQETIKREALVGITGRKPGERVNRNKVPEGNRQKLP